MRRLALWTLVASLLGTPGWASAQEASQETEARAARDEGLAAAEAGRHEEALEAFRRSIALVERASTYRNVGHQLVALDRFLEARGAYARCVELATVDARRERCQRRQAEMEERIAHLHLRVTPGSAVVEVDGRPLDGRGVERTVDLDAGQRRVAVTAPAHARWSETVDLAAGETRELVVALDPAPVATAPDVSTPAVTGAAPSGPSPPGASGLAPAGVAAMVAGAAVAAAGAVVLALGYVALDNVNGFGDGDAWSAYADDYDNAQSFTIIGWVALPVGVLAAGFGAVLLTLNVDEDVDEDVEVAVGPGGVLARGRF